MSKPEAPEPPPALVLNVNTIVAGYFYAAGTALPFKDESELPSSLRPFLATTEAPPPPPPFSRNLYDVPLSLRRQAARLEKGFMLQDAAEEEMSQPLDEDTTAALRAEQELHTGRAKMQAEVNAQRVDDTYKHLQEEAAGKVSQYFVRRGGEWAKTQNARLKPGETCFVKRESGEMEAAGTINAAGEPPPPEVIP